MADLTLGDAGEGRQSTAHGLVDIPPGFGVGDPERAQRVAFGRTQGANGVEADMRLVGYEGMRSQVGTLQGVLDDERARPNGVRRQLARRKGAQNARGRQADRAEQAVLLVFDERNRRHGSADEVRGQFRDRLETRLRPHGRTLGCF